VAYKVTESLQPGQRGDVWIGHESGRQEGGNGGLGMSAHDICAMRAMSGLAEYYLITWQMHGRVYLNMLFGVGTKWLAESMSSLFPKPHIAGLRLRLGCKIALNTFVPF
jgi:hypothetical protein